MDYPYEILKQKKSSITPSTNHSKPISNPISETKVIRHIASSKNEEKSMLPSNELQSAPIPESNNTLKLVNINFGENIDFSLPFITDRNDENGTIGKNFKSGFPEEIKSNQRNSTQSTSIKRKAFTPEEDQILRDSIQEYGLDWDKITPNLPGRTLKQCHDRYSNYLRPSMKAKPWTPEEDKLLEEMYLTLGKKWTKMTKKLPGRSSLDIKSRWEKNSYSKSERKIADSYRSQESYNLNVIVPNNYWSNRYLTAEQRNFNIQTPIKEHQVISNILPAVSPTEQTKTFIPNKDNETIMRYCSQIQYNQSIWDGDEDEINNTDGNTDKYNIEDKIRNRK